jgi:hypothetical protein
MSKYGWGSMSAINSFNASIELQHIYLEVYSERYCHLRTFLESYYCYQHGLVTKQGKPDWVQILKEAMPASYYQPLHEDYRCMNARFDVAGITLLRL